MLWGQSWEPSKDDVLSPSAAFGRTGATWPQICMCPESPRPPLSPALMDLLRAHVSALFSSLLSVQGPWKFWEEAQIPKYSHRVQVRSVPQVGYLEPQLAQAMAERAKWASLLGTASAGKGTVSVFLGAGKLNLGPFLRILVRAPAPGTCLTQTGSEPKFSVQGRNRFCVMLHVTFVFICHLILMGTIWEWFPILHMSKPGLLRVMWGGQHY